MSGLTPKVRGVLMEEEGFRHVMPLELIFDRTTEAIDYAELFLAGAIKLPEKVTTV